MAMHSLTIPGPTEMRIRAYFEYVWIRTKDHAGAKFMKELPHQLGARVSFGVHRPQAMRSHRNHTALT
jgi:hypothetical protein